MEKHWNGKFKKEYEMRQRLGKGGFGVVYRVRKKFDHADYAVKIVRLPKRLVRLHLLLTIASDSCSHGILCIVQSRAHMYMVLPTILSFFGTVANPPRTECCVRCMP